MENKHQNEMRAQVEKPSPLLYFGSPSILQLHVKLAASCLVQPLVTGGKCKCFVVAPSQTSQILMMNLSHKRCRQHMSSLGVLERTQRAATVVIVTNPAPLLYQSLWPSHKSFNPGTDDTGDLDSLFHTHVLDLHLWTGPPTWRCLELKTS